MHFNRGFNFMPQKNTKNHEKSQISSKVVSQKETELSQRVFRRAVCRGLHASADISFMVALQAGLTFLGNTTCAVAAYRLAASNGWTWPGRSTKDGKVIFLL